MSPPCDPALPCSPPPIVPGMPTSGSRPARPAPTVTVMAFAKFAPPPTVTRLPAIFDVSERIIDKADHHSADAFIANQDFGSAAEQPGMQTFVVAAGDDCLQFFDRTWLGK